MTCVSPYIAPPNKDPTSGRAGCRSRASQRAQRRGWGSRLGRRIQALCLCQLSRLLGPSERKLTSLSVGVGGTTDSRCVFL